MKLTKKVVLKMMKRWGMGIEGQPPQRGELVHFVVLESWGWGLGIEEEINLRFRAEKNARKWGWINRYGVLI